MKSKVKSRSGEINKAHTMVAQWGTGCRRREAIGRCWRLDRLEGISISNFTW